MVRFTDVGEFLEEIKKDAGDVEGRIIRITQQVTPSQKLPLSYVCVVATAKVKAEIVRLERFVGDYLSNDGKEIHAQAEKLVAHLTGRLNDIGASCALPFDIRAGVYE